MASEIFDYFAHEPNLTVFEHRFEHAKHSHFSIRDNSTEIIGFGGASNSKLAQTKSLFELIERTVFRSHGGDELSSSGWASHATLEMARKNAKLELIERDAAFVHGCYRFLP